MTIRESEDPAKGDLILLLDKSEIQELFALLDLVKVFIPEETLNAPVMDLIGDLIPPQLASIAAILLKGKTFGAILDQLSQELNAIPIEIGIYLYKDKPSIKSNSHEKAIYPDFYSVAFHRSRIRADSEGTCL